MIKKYSIPILLFLLAMIFTIILLGTQDRCLAQHESSKKDNAKSKDLTIRLVDLSGKPLQGAKVGNGREQWDHFNHSTTDKRGSTVRWNIGSLRLPPTISDSTGKVSLPYKMIFRSGGKRAIYAWHAPTGLVGLHLVKNTSSHNVTLKLQPACRVFGHIASTQLQKEGVPILETSAILGWNQVDFVLNHTSTNGEFEFLLPPGDYNLRIGGFGKGVGNVGTGGVPLVEKVVFITIKPGQRVLDLDTIELKPTELGKLVGKPAPKLNIKAWKNSEPIKLADLRGKFVLLEFWSYTCGPCVVNMPWIFKINDRYSKKGLVIITIHVNKSEIKSISDLDKKLEFARNNYWKGRDFPFPVGIDGGFGIGATHDAYKIDRWPTQILIGPDGKIVHVFESTNFSFFDRLLAQKKRSKE